MKSLGLDNGRNLSTAEYVDRKGEKRPCYSLNRDGMLQMLNSESALVRYKTIEYINQLEAENVQLKKIVKEYTHLTLPMTKYYLEKNLADVLKNYRDVEDYLVLIVDRADKESKDAKQRQQLYNAIQNRLDALLEADSDSAHQLVIERSRTYLSNKELDGAHSRLRGARSVLARVNQEVKELEEEIQEYEEIKKSLEKKKEEYDNLLKEYCEIFEKYQMINVSKLFQDKHGFTQYPIDEDMGNFLIKEYKDIISKICNGYSKVQARYMYKYGKSVYDIRPKNDDRPIYQYLADTGRYDALRNLIDIANELALEENSKDIADDEFPFKIMKGMIKDE